MSKRRKLAEEHEEHPNESWLIPYADILTLLLALFIVLFASSNIDKEKYQGIMESFQTELGPKVSTGTGTGGGGSGNESGVGIQSPLKPKPPLTKEPVIEEDADLKNLSEKLDSYIKNNNLNGAVSLQATKRGVEVTLQEIVLFDSGKADLKVESYKTLKGLLGIIQEIENPIAIEGHTDNVPSNTARFPTNWELSASRALSVLHFFVSNNIPPTQLQITGFGEYHPVQPNDNPEHRQANRRVTIAILRTD